MIVIVMREEFLTDKSSVWYLTLVQTDKDNESGGGRIHLPCINQQRAELCAHKIADAISEATNETVTVI